MMVLHVYIKLSGKIDLPYQVNVSMDTVVGSKTMLQ